MQFFAFCLPGVRVILRAPLGNSIEAFDWLEMEAGGKMLAFGNLYCTMVKTCVD
jgi:hypothetical protein